MNIATFLETDRDKILDAAIVFARTIPVLRETEDKTLRNHLPHVLEAISADLRSPQSRTEAITKSHGDADESLMTTSAQTHGLLRAQMGITVEQLVAEFRALRSSVLRLWGDAYSLAPGALEDVTRFNEAIDQAVAESVQFFAQEREQWRNIFLGVLGHDLRGPLNTIALTVQMMQAQGAAHAGHTALLSRGVKRLTSLLDSLLEYNRASFGSGMAVQRANIDLAAACAEELELLRTAHPTATIEYETAGDTTGQFDTSRVREALDNLVSNALKHGEASTQCVVRVNGDDLSVRVAV